MGQNGVCAHVQEREGDVCQSWHYPFFLFRMSKHSGCHLAAITYSKNTPYMLNFPVFCLYNLNFLSAKKSFLFNILILLPFRLCCWDGCTPHLASTPPNYALGCIPVISIFTGFLLTQINLGSWRLVFTGVIGDLFVPSSSCAQKNLLMIFATVWRCSWNLRDCFLPR